MIEWYRAELASHGVAVSELQEQIATARPGRREMDEAPRSQHSFPKEVSP